MLDDVADDARGRPGRGSWPSMQLAPVFDAQAALEVEAELRLERAGGPPSVAPNGTAARARSPTRSASSPMTRMRKGAERRIGGG